MGLRIAILGTRGIPANYGGFETFAEELGRRLVVRGHQITVYGRTHYVKRTQRTYQGVEVRRLPAVRQKYLDTVSHTILSTLDVIFRSYDGILICNAANAFLCWLPRLKGQKVVLNVDGIERHRRKWNRLAKEFYRLNETLATVFPHVVVTDARTIQEYYLRSHKCPSRFIPYGAPVGRVKGQRALRVLELMPDQYLLYVSRLEPENNAHQAIKAYLLSGLEIPFAVVGDAPYSKEYINMLIRLSESGKVLLPGAIYGERYQELLSHCRCYLHGAEVGGTHPGLLEAMGAGAVVIANDTPENREVVGDAGLLCSFEDLTGLAQLLREVESYPEKYADYRLRAQERVRHHYDWEKVTDQYEELFYELTR